MSNDTGYATPKVTASQREVRIDVPVASVDLLREIAVAKTSLKRERQSFGMKPSPETAIKIHGLEAYKNELDSQLVFARATESERDESVELDRLRSERERLTAEYEVKLQELLLKANEVITLGEALQVEKQQNSAMELVRQQLRQRGETMPIPTTRTLEQNEFGTSLHQRLSRATARL